MPISFYGDRTHHSLGNWMPREPLPVIPPQPFLGLCEQEVFALLLAEGPPTVTIHATGELYRDQNGALWRCTAGGTPGTWLQILPAFLTADPGSGTFLTGYMIVNVTSGQLKIHTGGLVWKTIHLPVAGGTLDDGANVAVVTSTGAKIGTAASQKLGFYGATPVAQSSVRPIATPDVAPPAKHFSIDPHLVPR